MIFWRSVVKFVRVAIDAGAEILLTGDMDFIESAITNPRIMTAAMFVQEYSSNTSTDLGMGHRLP
jgi:predicted nucleic acid-binding protein